MVLISIEKENEFEKRREKKIRKRKKKKKQPSSLPSLRERSETPGALDRPALGITGGDGMNFKLLPRLGRCITRSLGLAGVSGRFLMDGFILPTHISGCPYCCNQLYTH